MSSAISQISCFSSIHRRQQFGGQSRLYPYPKVLVVRGSRDPPRTEISSSDRKVTLSYTEDAVASQNDTSNSVTGEHGNGKFVSEPIDNVVAAEEKRGAKIHDFCFGIPFGGLVLSGGLLGCVFSRNLATLGTGVFFGGALLVLSTFSLKVWREGKSSLPFILGQAVLAASLLWKNVQSYSMTKKIFPTALNAAISAAMLCFYTYVVMSGGNPPPKKLKSATVAPS